MDATVLIVFIIVYGGMLFGEIPGLALDRTGIALLGAIVFLASGHINAQQAWSAIDAGTIGLLLGLMVVSAQLRLGGFYALVTGRLSHLSVQPQGLLGLFIAVAGVLSAVLANDIVCLAMAPVLIQGCALRSLNPVPFLLALACASNIGSAATIIGNPQNMLIGQALKLSFSGYMQDAFLPVAAGLLCTWLIICRAYKHDWRRVTRVPKIEAPPVSYWQTGKGLIIACCVIAAFVLYPVPREIIALTAAALLLTSRRMATREMLGQVDWQLLVLFAGLFIVNRVLMTSGMLGEAMQYLQGWGIQVEQPAWLFGCTVLLSNLVSNVPAVMLLLPAATHPLAGTIMALASTFAGNFIIIGSIANIIVIDQARRLHVRIGWIEHARVGVPVSVISLALAAAWLYWQSTTLFELYLIFK